MSKEVSSVYFHIDNGGVSFSVVDEGSGPVIEITASHFGHKTMNSRLGIKAEELAVLGEMFKHAAQYDGYSKEYCVAAKVYEVTPYALEKKLEEKEIWLAPKFGSGFCSAGDPQEECDEGDDLSDLDEGQCCKTAYKQQSWSNLQILDQCCKTSPKEKWAQPQSKQQLLDEELETAGMGSWADDWTMPAYPYQYIQNESTEVVNQGLVSTFKIAHLPVLPGTLVGVIYRGTHCEKFAVQTFTVLSDGKFNLMDTWNPTCKVVAEGSSLDVQTGELKLQWTDEPGSNYVTVSYEYVV